MTRVCAHLFYYFVSLFLPYRPNFFFFSFLLPNAKAKEASVIVVVASSSKIERNKKSAKRNTHTHNMFSLSASSFVGTSVSASFKGTRDAFVAKGRSRVLFERGVFFFVLVA